MKQEAYRSASGHPLALNGATAIAIGAIWGTANKHPGGTKMRNYGEGDALLKAEQKFTMYTGGR